MKVIDKINRDLEKLANLYASGNAHGIPVTRSGKLTLVSISDLRFEQQIDITSPFIAKVLKQLAEILEKYF